ncbi:MAG: sulfatase-like hydrolase/transferase [Spirochaetales bacterium]|nr:sulfatase-like hydrolase/transferase [Spirochaetales bacterium]
MSKNRPNVVIFFSDQQRADSLGINGNPMNITPNLDRAAVEGTNIPYAFSPQPVCLPARACLQTGYYASQIGCDTNNGMLPEDVPKLADYFNDAGYRTGYIGKWHLHQTKNIIFDKPQGGYQYWLAENISEFVSDAYNTVLHDGEGREHSLPGYRVDAVTDAAIRYIDEVRDEPFMMMVSHLEPHHQNHRDAYPAPHGYEEMYNDPWTPPDLKTLGGSSARHLPGYYGMIKRLDEAYGRLLDALRSRGILENTIVLYSSDHGCHFKTRNGEYKRSCHDASTRIPMVITGGPFNSGGQLRDLVSLVDIPSTLLDACGIEVPAHMMGRSILPLLKGERDGWPQEVYTEISESHTGRCIRTKRWKYSIRKTGENRYTEDFLYDLENDPWELDNLIGMVSFKEIRDDLKKRLLSKMKETGQTVPEIEDAPVKDHFMRTLEPEEWHG